MLRNCCLAWLFVFFWNLALSQENASFKHYGIDQGLSQGTVNDIKFDHNGILWAATNDGLNRFNGYEFKTLKKLAKPDGSFINITSINSIFITSENKIWISTIENLLLFDPKTLTIEHILPQEDYVGILHYDANNQKVRFSLKYQTPILYNFKQQAYERFHSTLSELGDLGVCDTTGAHAAMFYNSNGYIYSIIEDTRILYLNPSNKTWKTHSLPRKEAVSHLFYFTNNSIVCPYKNELYIMDQGNGKHKQIPYSKELYNSNITELTIDNNNHIWLSTYNKGLFSIDILNKNIQHYSHNPTQSNSLISNQLIALELDSNQNIWLGTVAYGIEKFNPKSQFFKTINTQHNFNLNSDFIRAIYKNGNTIYLGTNDKGLDIIDLKTKKVQHYDFPTYVDQKYINAVLNISPSKFHEGVIWIGTYANGLWKYDNGKISHFVQNINGVWRTFNNIVEINKYTLLGILNGNSELTLVKHSATAPITETIYLGKEDQSYLFRNKEKIWLTCRNDLYHITSIKPFNLKKVFEGSALIKHVYEINNQELLISTTNGLIHLIDFKIHHTYNEETGLLNANVYGVLPLNEKEYWISTNKGLSKINIETKSCTNYTVDDGLQGNEFNTGAFFKSEDDVLYFGGMNGVNYFPAQLQFTQTKNNRVVLDRISINDEALNYMPNDSIFNLAYSENTISFDFVSNNFSAPELSEYAVKLDKVDETWVNLGTKHFIRYPQLSPGKYTLHLKTKQNSSWGPESTFTFYIKPPLWLKPWFLALAGITITIIVILIIRYISRYRLEQELMEMKVAQKIEEDRTRISRELHDNIGSQLSLIISNIETMGIHLDKNHLKETTALIQSTHANSKLIMQQLRETIWTLRSTEIPIKSFQARIESYLRTFFKDSNIHLDFTIQNVTEPILKPLISLTLFRIIQEVATNCLKYSNASKFIVEIKTSSGQMELVLKDDGIGFDTKKQSSGYGIENIIARAEEIKAKMTLYSEPTLGTEFYIKLKLK